MASSQNFFVWFCRVLNCQQGLIPHRTKSCGVSDPAEQDPAGYQTPQNLVLRGIRPCRTMAELCTFYSIHLFCGVWYPAEQWSAGSDAPLNKVLRGIRPRGTTFNNEYFFKFEKEFKNILGCKFVDYMGSIRGKNQRSKISCYCPFKPTSLHAAGVLLTAYAAVEVPAAALQHLQQGQQWQLS